MTTGRDIFIGEEKEGERDDEGKVEERGQEQKVTQGSHHPSNHSMCREIGDQLKGSLSHLSKVYPTYASSKLCEFIQLQSVLQKESQDLKVLVLVQ